MHRRAIKRQMGRWNPPIARIPDAPLMTPKEIAEERAAQRRDEREFRRMGEPLALAHLIPEELARERVARRYSQREAARENSEVRELMLCAAVLVVLAIVAFIV
jgi:hypothetical protein